MSGRADQPAPPAARELAGWLQGPRSRALRRAGIGRRERVLDVGSGHGVVTRELVRRCPGLVVALDIDRAAVSSDYPAGAARVCADARALPLADAGFDLAFFQNVLLWAGDAPVVVHEAARVLAPGGALVALEPDYGGMIEHPELGLREAWIAGLLRAGGDPLIGRKLPALCEAAGLQVWVELAHVPAPAEADALELLAGLPLTDDERSGLAEARKRVARAIGEWQVFLHVPYFLVVAERRE